MVEGISGIDTGGAGHAELIGTELKPKERPPLLIAEKR